MTVDAVVEMANRALYLIMEVALPILLVSLVIGLIISIFQTVTSIQEQTLTFIPKIVCVFAALMIMGQWMMTKMVDYAVQLWSSFTMYVHK